MGMAESWLRGMVDWSLVLGCLAMMALLGGGCATAGGSGTEPVQEIQQVVARDELKEKLDSHLGAKGWSLGADTAAGSYVVAGQAEIVADEMSADHVAARVTAFEEAELKAKAELLRVRDGITSGRGNVRGFLVDAVLEGHNAEGRPGLIVVGYWSPLSRDLVSALAEGRPLPAGSESFFREDARTWDKSSYWNAFGATPMMFKGKWPGICGFGMAGCAAFDADSSNEAAEIAELRASAAIGNFLDGSVLVEAGDAKSAFEGSSGGVVMRTWRQDVKNGACVGRVSAWYPPKSR